jgi:hypothetical protein
MTKILLVLLMITTAYAEHLVPVPFVKQLSESDGVLLGEFKGKSYKRMHDGKVVTESSFLIDKTIGIDSRYLVNKNIFKIYYDGGVYQDMHYDNENAPEFEEGREYVIVLKRDSFGYRPYMEKLGAYTITYNRDNNFLISQAFPEHPNLGVIPLNRFNMWVRSVYGSSLGQKISDKYTNIEMKARAHQQRSPSSVEEEKSLSANESTIGIFWVALIFGFLGAARMRKVRTHR